MNRNLSRFARVRIGVLATILVAILVVTWPGRFDTPAVLADHHKVGDELPGNENGGGGECAGFCGDYDGRKNVCPVRQCCGAGQSVCEEKEYLTKQQVDTYVGNLAGTSWVAVAQTVACESFDCEPAGVSCGQGTCGTADIGNDHTYTEYEAAGNCPPTQ